MKWYAIHTYSGYENKVKSTIEHKVQVEGLRERVADVLIPAKKFVEIKSGKKHDVMRNIMPGYVLIQMEDDEELFAVIQKMPGVSGFLGDGIQPIPMGDEEVVSLRETIEERSDRQKSAIQYRVTDQVKVIEGPFANFIGSVEHVDQDKGKLKVLVSIFGRPTSVELDVLQVEAI